MYALTFPACKADDYEPEFLRVRNSCGCFAESTKITMADGSVKPINTIVKGDAVRNPITGKAVLVDHVVRGPESQPLYRIAWAGGEVVVTHDHPFPVVGKGVLAARAMRKDMVLTDISGQAQKITKITTVAWKTSKPVVWNLYLDAGSDDEDHYLIADGIVTGDLWLQEKIAKKRLAAQ